MYKFTQIIVRGGLLFKSLLWNPSNFIKIFIPIFKVNMSNMKIITPSQHTSALLCFSKLKKFRHRMFKKSNNYLLQPIDLYYIHALTVTWCSLIESEMIHFERLMWIKIRCSPVQKASRSKLPFIRWRRSFHKTLPRKYLLPLLKTLKSNTAHTKYYTTKPKVAYT